MFEEVVTRIQLEVQSDSLDAYDAAFGLKRESLFVQLKQHQQILFDDLLSDAEKYFNLKATTTRTRLRSQGRIPAFAVKEYLNEKGLKFAENQNLEAKRVGDLFGTIRWACNLSSFQCIKMCNMGFFGTESFVAKSTFTFIGKNVHVRHDPEKTSRHLKHHYLFDLCDQNNNVRSSVPFELEYDIFTAPTAIYCFGSRLLLVTSFYKIMTNLIFKMLKQHDALGEMPQSKPSGYYNAYFFALFDSNFKLSKVYMTSENRKIGSYLITVDFINDRGIMISKKFQSMRVPGTHEYSACSKRLITFFDYNFEPIFKDMQLPGSASISNVLKIDANLIYYVGYDTVENKRLTFTVFDSDNECVVNTKLIPRRGNPYLPPSKFLLDGKNNIYLLTRAHYNYGGYVKTHGYFLGCVNVDTHEWHEIDPPSDQVFYRGCYLNESDQLVIVSKPDPKRELIFNTFGF